MARLVKTIQDYQEQLKEKGIQDIPEFIQFIINSDITKGKYSRFLLDCFIADKFRKEDLKGGLESTIGEAISLFHKHKSKLPEDMRSVYKYESPGDLWSAVKQFDGELSGKEIKRSEQDKVYAETEFVYTDEETGFKIISPLTEEASKWWGKGTRWCTAAKKNNAFWNYADKAPLLILLMSGGEKLQLWKNGDNIQFMDEADNEVEINYIENNWNVLEPVCRWLKDLEFIPQKLIDYDMCLEAVKQDGQTLKNVPDKLIDYRLCLEAVKQDGYSLRYIPEYYKDYNLCLKAIKQYGNTLEYIPEKLKDYDICLEAVQQYGYSLRYVPEEYRDFNMCLEAVKNYGEALKYVPKKLIDYNLCLEAVKQNVNALYSVPDEYKDYNLCSEASKRKSSKYIQEEIVTIKKNNQQILEEKYQQTFSEIRSAFPEKNLSLTI